MKKFTIMKKILLLTISAIGLFTAQLKAQVFSVSSDTVNATVVSSAVIHDDITNNTSSNITVRWSVVATSFPTDWLNSTAFGICDNNLCRNNNGDTLLWRTATSTPGTLFISNAYAPSVAGTFDLSMNLDGASTGSHWVTIALTDGSYTKNVTFVLNKWPTAVTSVNSDNEINMYPNPAHDELNIVYSPNADVHNIAVYNIIGKVMMVYKVTGPSANLNLENIPAGVYFVRLTNSRGEMVTTKKFTKQ
jgi:hypothetical protein